MSKNRSRAAVWLPDFRLQLEVVLAIQIIDAKSARQSLTAVAGPRQSSSLPCARIANFRLLVRLLVAIAITQPSAT